MEVIDGQHRLAAAEELGYDIFYMICPELTKKDLAILNSNQKNWSMMDFVTFYKIEGFDEYKKFSRLVNKYPKFSYSSLFAISGGTSRSAANDVRAGLLRMNHYERAIIVCDQVTKIWEGLKIRPGDISFCFGRNFLYAVDSLKLDEKQVDRIILKSKNNQKDAETRHNITLFFQCDSLASYRKMFKDLL